MLTNRRYAPPSAKKGLKKYWYFSSALISRISGRERIVFFGRLNPLEEHVAHGVLAGLLDGVLAGLAHAVGHGQ